MLLGPAATSSYGIIFCIFITVLAIMMARRPELSARRLIGGYIGAVLVFAILIAVQSYFPVDEALAQWQVPPENYIATLSEHFYLNFIVYGFWCLIGVSLIGIPVLVALAVNNRASAPWLIAASAVVALTASVFIEMFLGLVSMASFFEMLCVFLPVCCLTTTGFALGARLPWASGFRQY